MNKILLHGGLAARRMALAYLTGRFVAHGVEIKALHSRLDINDVEELTPSPTPRPMRFPVWRSAAIR